MFCLPSVSNLPAAKTHRTRSLLRYPPLGRLSDQTLKNIEQGIKLALQLL